MSDYDSDQGSYRGGSGSEPEVIHLHYWIKPWDSIGFIFVIFRKIQIHNIVNAYQVEVRVEAVHQVYPKPKKIISEYISV